MDEKQITAILTEIGQNYTKARSKHAPMHSAHEGYAVIKEEFDELWDEVKAWQPLSFYRTNGTPAEAAAAFADNNARMRKEALHVAAMALSFVIEVCDK